MEKKYEFDLDAYAKPLELIVLTLLIIIHSIILGACGVRSIVLLLLSMLIPIIISAHIVSFIVGKEKEFLFLY